MNHANFSSHHVIKLLKFIAKTILENSISRHDGLGFRNVKKALSTETYTPTRETYSNRWTK
jgi:hypothetical protein